MHPGSVDRLPRRTFLKGLAAASACAATLPLLACVPQAAAHSGWSGTQARVLRQLVQAMLPGDAQAPQGMVLGLPARLDRALDRLPPGMRDDLATAIGVLAYGAPLAGRFIPLPLLPDREVGPYLEACSVKGIEPVAVAFASLRQALVAVYYQQPETWAAIGYPGPQVGHRDMGYGLDNQDPIPPINPRVHERGLA